MPDRFLTLFRIHLHKSIGSRAGSASGKRKEKGERCRQQGQWRTVPAAHAVFTHWTAHAVLLEERSTVGTQQQYPLTLADGKGVGIWAAGITAGALHPRAAQAPSLGIADFWEYSFQLTVTACEKETQMWSSLHPSHSPCPHTSAGTQIMRHLCRTLHPPR